MCVCAKKHVNVRIHFILFAFPFGKLFAFWLLATARSCRAIKVWFPDIIMHMPMLSLSFSLLYGTCETSLINYCTISFHDCFSSPLTRSYKSFNCNNICGHLIYDCPKRMNWEYFFVECVRKLCARKIKTEWKENFWINFFVANSFKLILKFSTTWLHGSLKNYVRGRLKGRKNVKELFYNKRHSGQFSFSI